MEQMLATKGNKLPQGRRHSLQGEKLQKMIGEKVEKAQEESSTAGIMAELIKIQEAQGKLQETQEKIQASQKKMESKLEKMIKDEMGKLGEEIKEEIQAVKTEMNTMQKEINDIKKENVAQKKTVEKTNKRVDKLEELTQKINKMQERTDRNETEYQIRIRNIEENEQDNLRNTVIEITAKILDVSTQEMDKNIDRVYRVQTMYAKKKGTARDIVAHLARKHLRDQIIKNNTREPTTYKGKKVIILKEISISDLSKRKQYYFLTDELKKLHIKFRWERTEGIMATYNEEKQWITSVEKAKIFYQKIKEDQEDKKKKAGRQPPREEEREADREDMEITNTLDPTKRNKGEKRARETSPEDYGKQGMKDIVTKDLSDIKLDDGV
ncbi:uncharacterized protein PF3D7_1120000-like [Anolis sagrei]|uniref:uncharacterized protein PF3D7_1120000-like n=1 Tax=Anolis sagrei TaxID=38937 RepID=UPI0035215D57